MDLKVTIEGLGKISEGRVDLKGFTVFAGRNNTGKTFVSKAIYSALKGASSNHAWNLIGGEVQNLSILAATLHSNSQTRPAVLEELGKLASTPSHFLGFLDRHGDDYAKRVRDIAAGIDAIYKKQDRQKAIKELEVAGSMAPETDVEMIEKAMDEIKKFAKFSGEQIVRGSIGAKMPKFLMENFRSRGLDPLARETSKGFKITIDNCLEIESKQGNFSGQWASPSAIVNIPSLFYIDAVGLKVNSQLIRDYSSLKSRFDMIPEIPRYHTDLIDTIEAITLVPNDSLASISTEIAEKIGGKLKYDNGLLNFHEEGGSVHDASLTSSGILQLGLLGLIAEKGLLREESFLFIDEPETNLHPAWQVLMTGMLCRLAVESKVNIGIATHSPYILQYLRYGAEHDDQFKPILSVSHFTDKGINKNIEKMENHDKLEHIEADLNEIYMDIFLKGTASV